MAGYTGSVWAIEIGNESLKALHLAVAGDNVQVLGFESLSHGKILSGAGVKDAERDELIALTLRHFLREHNLGKDAVIVSVPSQNSFARFVNLPPVEEKKIPQVVKLEAGMQIPFDMNDVQWDWQIMSEPGAPEARVGIFAIKNEVVVKELDYYANEGIAIGGVQMAPMALYNYIAYDRPDLVKNDKTATVVINVGAEGTDLVVCSKSTVWQRFVPIGGNAFTRAIAETFKLNFNKAEKLKRTAAMSKYARQVFQAMRPVFSDFASEIQRSLGFYSNSNPDCKIKHVIAMGGGTKLRGLLKYLQQTLQLPVEKPDSFKRIAMSEGVSEAKFGESVSDFGVVYGLALQGLECGKIETNLLPKTIASSMAWASKAKFFTIAAAVLLIVGALSIARTILDSAKYKTQQDIRTKIDRVVRDAEDAKRKLENQQGREIDSEELISQAYKPFENRELIPQLYETILSLLPNTQNNPEQRSLYNAFDRADVAAVRETPRSKRKQIFITSMQAYYTTDLERAQFGQTRKSKKKSSGGGMGMDMGMGMGMEGMMYPGMMPGMGNMGMMSPMGGRSDTTEEEDTSNHGFVITIAGYLPYGKAEELLDPSGVQDDKSRWGFVTRLIKLDEVVDGNSLFELYEKTNLEHFKLDYGTVSLDEEIPAGIGIRKQLDKKADKRKSKDYVLIDPMTKEVINKTVIKDDMGRNKLDRNGKPLYQVNDHWFELKIKLKWRSGQTESDEDA